MQVTSIRRRPSGKLSITVLENPPTATENEVDDLLLTASQAYKAEEASEWKTEEPPTARTKSARSSALRNKNHRCLTDTGA